ncbi:MAG: helix-turn-helix transcriptional regulator, partial [Oliverpabstia sp.]
MTFSDKIKVSRELCNLTQQQLADKVGVSKRTIAAYETTDAKARSSTMRK